MRDNINERREYIKELLNNGETVDARAIAKLFNSSFPAVTNDIAVVISGSPLYKKKTTTTQNTRAKRLGVPGTLTEDDWNKTLETHNHACVICGTTESLLTLDHIKPVSKQGTNTGDNIQPLCKSCNSRKGNR